MRELAEADARGIAVAADAEHEQIAIRELRAGRCRRHAAVNAVKAVRLFDEVRGRF